MQKAKKKGKLQQLPTSVAESAESPTDEDVGKDFGTLINAPLSRGGHFVFKSEKAWTVDSSQYSEFFTLNLKTLSAAIDCIPFNEYVNVADRYFVNRFSSPLESVYPAWIFVRWIFLSGKQLLGDVKKSGIIHSRDTKRYSRSDQLTSIYNDAERSKAVYNAILDDLKAPSLSNTKSETKENTRTDQSKNMESATNTKPESSIDDLEEDLDFLLSLKEPVQSTMIGVTQPISLSTHSSDSKTKSKNISHKPIDLEKWLDSVLDD